MGRTAFHASFLLAVPFLKDVPKSKRKKAKREPKKKKRNAKDGDVEEIKEKIEEEKPFTGQMEVGKPTVFIHVEYTIIPDILMYDFDVVCYGDVAKIYTRDSNTSVKTTVKGNVAWIAFSIHHTIHMSDDLLVELHNATVAFNVWNDKKKQFKTTQADKPKKFTMLDEDIDKAKAGKLNTMFVPLKECDMDGNIVNTDAILPSLSVLVKNSLRAIPYPCHCKPIETLVKQVSDSLQIVKPEGDDKISKKGKDTELSDGSENEEIGKTGKKGGKDKKGKKSLLAGSQQLTMLGEVFFANITDTKIEKKFESRTIPYMAVIFTVVDLFIGNQLNYFNPAVVHIRDVNNIPVKLFQKYGFDEIFLSYTLPNDKEYVTARKRVDKVVSFNDVRVMLIHDQDATRIMEFILTQFLRVKLWGVRDERYCEARVPHELFRLTESNRCMLSRLLPDPFSHPYSKTDSEAVRFVKDKTASTVCLAEMEMNLSALASNQLLVECTNNFRRPRATHEYGSTSGSWVYYNLPDVHEPARVEPVNASPFTDFLLQKTTVDVAFKTLAPLTATMMGVFASKEHYNRIVVVITGSLEGKLCTDIIEEIYKTNKPYVRSLKPPNDLFYARKEFLKPHVGEYSETITEELQGKQHFYLSRRGMFHTPVYARSALTGFILDNGDRVLIVLEGRAQSSLLKFFSFLEDLDVSSGFIVHYNSEMAFKTRLYHDFLEMGGVMVITMDEPIEVKQIRKQFLLSRSTGAPSRAVQTINKLNNLFSVKDIATACRQDFFPSAMHLVSFATEFGVPFRLIDDYTLPPTPPRYSLNPTIIEEDLPLISKESAPTQLKPMRSNTTSIGFDAMDSYSKSCPGKFTVVHACSSLNVSNMSQATIISEMGIPTVNAMAAVYTPSPTTNTSDVESSTEEAPTERKPDAGGDSRMTTSLNKDTKQTTRSRFSDPKSRSKQDDGSKQTGGTVSTKLPKKPPQASTIVGQLPIIPVIPAEQQEQHRILDQFPSLLLPRKPLQGTYSSYSSASDAGNNKPKTPRELHKLSIEPSCSIQEKYFRDFLSGINVKKIPKAKANRMQTPKRESTGTAQAKDHKKYTGARGREFSVDAIFPPDTFKDEFVGALDTTTYRSMERHHSVVRPRKRSVHKKPDQSPEPECPIQEYFENYFENIIQQED